MNTKKTFIFYNDWVDYLSEMTLEEKGLFLQAILDYQNGIDVVPEWCIKFIWGRVKNQLDSDRAKWEEVRKKRIDAGRLGWINKWKQMLANANKCLALPSDAKHSQANQAVNVNDNDNVNVNANDNVTTTTTTTSSNWNVSSHQNDDSEVDNEVLFDQFVMHYPKKWSRNAVRSAFDKLTDINKRMVVRDAIIEKWMLFYWLKELRYEKNPSTFLEEYSYSEIWTLTNVRSIVTPLRHKEQSEEELVVRKKCFHEIGMDIVKPIWKSMDKKIWFVFHDE